MLALVEITPWHWVGFILCVVLFLALDLGYFHRAARVVTFREALAWSSGWVLLAVLFGAALPLWRDQRETTEFFTAYFLELSLSMDNVFVIALVFTYFQVPAHQQHRVLFWGILGALISRGAMILAGVALINRFDFVLYLLGFVLLYAGVKMLWLKTGSRTLDRSPVVRLAKRLLPLTPRFDGQNFMIRVDGRRKLTMLFLVLLVIEANDIIFAVDSIPAVFGVTRRPFIVFTSNILAVLGLRSLYFVLAGAIRLFRFLNVGLSLVLVFIGVKMLIDPHDRPPLWFQYDIPDGTALIVVVGIIAAAILLSLIVAWRSDRRAPRANPEAGL
jgi:tellurite resistance protein TerC